MSLIELIHTCSCMLQQCKSPAEISIWLEDSGVEWAVIQAIQQTLRGDGMIRGSDGRIWELIEPS